MPPPEGVPPNLAFENKAGRYQLVRVEGDMAHYSFTNHHGQQNDAVMPMATWRRLQERVQAAAEAPKAAVC